jgi:hypothetical protein
MSLPTSYLTSTKNLDAYFNAILSAEAPDRFTNKFLENLGFTSSYDRLFIGILKALGFLEESGAPTQRYFNYLDQSQSGAVLAEAIREAYSDLFNVKKDAQKLPADEVKNKLKTLFQGKKSDKVLGLMAATFTKLCEFADWESKVKPDDTPKKEETVPQDKEHNKPSSTIEAPLMRSGLGLHYNIQIHLPESRDQAVYDAIFVSLKNHLL